MQEIITRQEEYRILEKRVNSFLEGFRQNIALIGPSSCGKTYLVEQFFKTRSLDDKALIVYVDLEFLSFAEFIRASFASLLFHFLKKHSCSDYDLDALILQAQTHIPQTTEKIKHILGMLDSKEKASFDWVTGVFDAFIAETKTKTLLVVDNFTAIRSFPRRVLSEFAKYIITQKDILFVFISKNVKAAEQLLSQELNILFGSFEKIYMDSFSHIEAEFYLNRHLIDKTSASLIKFLVELTDGFPLYLDIITKELLKNPDQTLDATTFFARLARLLVDARSPLLMTFKNKLALVKASSRDTFLINPLLITIAEGYTRRKDLISLLKIDAKTLNAKLNKLTELDLVTKNGSFFFVSDKLFSFWLSSAFKTMVNVPFIFRGDNRRAVEERLSQRFEEFRQASLQDNCKRFIDLVQMFRDDTVKTQRKSLSLPQIQRLKIVPTHSKDMTYIIGEAKQYYLILAFKDGFVEETDILEFSNRCSYFRHKPPKKIFITLKKPDATAKVLAKEKRLFFWEKEDVNLLLRLYNRPSII
ncbi:ATP-binding protein [Candidatus Omnitrophota bacterium]